MQRGPLIAVFVIAGYVSLVVLTLGGGVLASERAAESNKMSLSDRPPVARAPLIESCADETPTTGASNPHHLRGWPPSNSVSPGTRVGITWYEKQHNGTVGRQVDWGTDIDHDLSIHFLWTRLPTSNIAQSRAYAYNFVTSNQDTIYEETLIQSTNEYAGYVCLDVTTDNRAVAGGHNNEGDGYSCHFYWDYDPLWAFFSINSRVPDDVQLWQAQNGGEYTIWPKMRYQDIPGQTPVLHAFAQTSMPDAADPQAIYYFRKVGADDTGDWDYPPYIVDTIFNISQDVACSNVDGKVALVWNANRCPDLSTCDTCSDNTGNVAEGSVQLDNDLYYQLSYDYGATWQPRVNVTKYREGEAGFRLYTDLSALITADNDLHIGWSGRVWPANPDAEGVGFDCAMFHWGENLGFNTSHPDGLTRGNIATVETMFWDQTTCNGGSWMMNGAKMSISECDGKLYFLWVQFNDIPNGVEDDCAQRGIDGSDVSGSANGELFMSVSSDGGWSWDEPRNLTNTYSPGCDSADGLGGRCQAEVWPNMARHGTNLTFATETQTIIDLSGGYTGDYYLDVQYIDDPDAGSIVSDEGSWQMADVRWFRVACVDPVPNPNLVFSPWQIHYPTHTGLGVQLDTAIALTNHGNGDVNFSITIEEDTGPTGWLTVSGLESGFVPYGGDTTFGTLHLNTGGIVNVDPTFLSGQIIFEGNFLTSPDTLPIALVVTDNFVEIEHDTLYADDATKAPYLALTIGNNGNYGNRGQGHVNLDYFDYGDCDVYDEEIEDDPYPGDASVYLYDGSPIICWDAGDSIECQYSMYGETWLNGRGFIPQGWHYEKPDWIDGNCSANILGASFITRDTSILLEQYFFAPVDIDDPQFMIKAMRVTNLTVSPITGLAIGEAIDWDVPSDSGVWNSSSFDGTRSLIYQQGSEFNQDTECMENDQRYAGIAVASVIVNGSSQPFWGMYTMDNSTQVFPDSTFDADSLWYYMENNTGYTVSDTTEGDLHTVATYVWDHTLGVGDELLVLTVLVTGKNGVADFRDAVDEGLFWVWCNEPCACCVIMGDVDHDGDGPNIADLVYLVNFMFNGGPPPPCVCPAWYYPETDIDGNGSGPDIADLIYLVNYMFNGGPAPAPCP